MFLWGFAFAGLRPPTPACRRCDMTQSLLGVAQTVCQYIIFVAVTMSGPRLGPCSGRQAAQVSTTQAERGFAYAEAPLGSSGLHGGPGACTHCRARLHAWGVGQ